MYNYAIGIPTIIRADLLNETLLKYEDDFKDVQIFIVDNGNQDIVKTSNVVFLDNGGKNGVARSWNLLIKTIFAKGYDAAFILNDDIYCGLTQVFYEHVLNTFSDADFIVGENFWCSFFVRKSCIEKVGYFDENFDPAYFEDNDYAYRIKLASAKRVNTNLLNPLIFRNSQSIAKDPTLNKNFEVNRRYYISKWGGAPEMEVFTNPFNKKP